MEKNDKKDAKVDYISCQKLVSIGGELLCFLSVRRMKWVINETYHHVHVQRQYLSVRKTC